MHLGGDGASFITHVISCRLSSEGDACVCVCMIRCRRRDQGQILSLSPFFFLSKPKTMASQTHQVFPSILDNDLYKFTMQYAVLKHYRDAQVVYEFTNRDKELQLNAEAVEWLEKQIKGIDDKTCSFYLLYTLTRDI